MSRLIRNLIFNAFSAASVLGHTATLLAQGGPPSKDSYIIVLKPAKNGVPELTDHDITAGGGKVEYKVPGQVQVTLPEQAVDAMRKHGGVKYIQKVILGPLPDASASASLAPSASAMLVRTAPEATPPTWSSGTYQYDKSGNIYAIGLATDTGSPVQHRYAYDELSRLKKADTIAASTQSQTFTYDIYGNLTAQQMAGFDAVATPVETSNSNRLAAGFGHPYTYDAAGNLTADYNVTYDYDPFNMLREKDRNSYPATQEYYIYTASDERIGVTYHNMNDNPTIWSIRDFGGNVLRQYKSHDEWYGMAWLWMEDYVYRGGQLLAAERVPEEGGRRHFHLDHLGSPRLVTGPDSKEMSEHDYEPFGLESNPLWQETNGGFDREDPKRFTGHERDYAAPGESPASTAYLDYMHARYYSPTVDRFLSVDAVLDQKLSLGTPQAWNRYAYVRDNPTGLIDPNGTEPLDPKLLLFYNRILGGDFSRVDIQSGPIADVVTKTPRNLGMTVGQEIFLNSDLGFPFTQASLEAVGHELTHTVQYDILGKAKFLSRYFMAYGMNRTMGMSGQDAYTNIPYEVLANYAEKSLKAFLTSHPGITSKLEHGEAFTRADWDEVKKFQVFKPGLQFIDGYLVYARPQ